MSDLVIEISKYPAYSKSLNKADAVEGEKSAKAFDGKIETDKEKLEAAKLISGKSYTNVAEAEKYLIQQLEIKEAPAGATSSKGAQIKSVASNWGKSGLKTKGDGNTLTIEGSLNDAELYTVFIEPLSAKEGQKLVFDLEVDGTFTWGGKILSIKGMPEPEVTKGRVVDDGETVWITNVSGKTTVSIPITRDKTISSLSIKTGGMSEGFIKISNIRVE